MYLIYIFFRTPSTGAERREQYLTYLLVSIVAVFLFCHSLKFFLLFYKELDVRAAINISLKPGRLIDLLQVKRTLRNLECSQLGVSPRYS